MRLTMILLSLCLISLASTEVMEPGKMDIEINVKEGEHRFVQKIKSNMYDNVVYYYNPRHSETSETHMMQDFNTGVQISCWPATQRCYMGDIDKTAYPDAPSTIANVAIMWQQGVNSIQSDRAGKVYHDWIINGTEITDNVFLSSSLRKFLSMFNFPLFPISPLPVDAEFITGTFQPSNKDDKQKRLTDAKVCSDGSFARAKYGYTEGRCDHLHFCQYKGYGKEFDCGSHHVIGRRYFTCFCCPKDTTITQCVGCTENKFIN